MDALKVKDFMDKRAVTFTPEMSLTAALDKVIRSEHMGGPVVNTDGDVIGFLSEQDLLEKLVKVSYHCQDTHIVSDCMYQEVLSVTPEMGIIELASLMKIGKPKVYPVVDNNKLLGIITRRDVLKAIGHSLDDCFKRPV
ncbi:CBS domain-containing protein [Vibrio sp. MACH09]|uniref:CBS domain-containing protein n=1 Tax=unclassified Vibrio TaxID=2614977 RepID=UPI001493A7B5|nr:MULTISPECIES: CBS domain-containing protein [unclassified Vibrio]NOI67568.1 CBS domain-containing protein [Vibrio sp. 99-8-1]GLO61297.1 CBS domain-containing protein [Vibrio sp. MACH09]